MNLIHHTQSTCNNEQIHYSVSRSETSQAGTHAHILFHCVKITLLSPARKKSYSAFQMFDMNQATCHELRLDIKHISISSSQVLQIISVHEVEGLPARWRPPGVSDRRRPPGAVWTVGGKQKEQQENYNTSQFILFPKLERRLGFLTVSGESSSSFQCGCYFHSIIHMSDKEKRLKVHLLASRTLKQIDRDPYYRLGGRCTHQVYPWGRRWCTNIQMIKQVRDKLKV